MAVQQSRGHTYYISSDGSDDNDGTELTPFATFEKAQSVVKSGDLIFVRGTLFMSKVIKWTVGGVVIIGYPNDPGVLDFERVNFNSQFQPGLLIRAKNVILDNLTLQNCLEGRGIVIDGNDGARLSVVLNRINITHCKNSGITIKAASHCVVQNCIIEETCLVNEHGVADAAGKTHPVAVRVINRVSRHNKFLFNTLKNNWGEVIGCAGDYTLAVGNTIVNGVSVGIYVDSGRYAKVVNNLVLFDNPAFKTIRQGQKRGGTGIMFAYEGGPSNPGSNTTVGGVSGLAFGNVVLGWDDGIAYWFDSRNTNNANTYALDILHNTILSPGRYGLRLKAVPDSNNPPTARIQNNYFAGFEHIVEQPEFVEFGGNAWALKPGFASGDIEVNEPKFVDQLGAVEASSPLVGAGISLENTTTLYDDRWGHQRIEPLTVGAYHHNMTNTQNKMPDKGFFR